MPRRPQDEGCKNQGSLATQGEGPCPYRAAQEPKRNHKWNLLSSQLGVLLGMRNKQQIQGQARAILNKLAPQYPVLANLPIRISTRMTRAAGRASWRGGIPVEITLSLPFFADEANDLHRTVTHEAAHIVAGHAAGHGPTWKAVHRSMGGKGDRCHTMSLAEGFKHTPRKRAPRVEVTCPKCSQPMLLGPTQAKKAQRGYRYTHARCPR